MKKVWLPFAIMVFLLQCNVVKADNNETILPLQFNTGDKVNGLPSTEIIIQDKKIPLIFDTGAAKAGVALSSHALQGINVKFTQQQRCYKALDGQHCAKEFFISEIQLGKFTIKNVFGIHMQKLWGGNNKHFISSDASRNGVIGLGLLSQFNLLLDYPHHQAILVKPQHTLTEYNIQEWLKIPFKLEGGIITEANIDGTPLKLVWDTGAFPSSMKGILAKQPLTCPKEQNYDNPHCRFIISKHFSINNIELPNTQFLLVKLPKFIPMDGFVGSNFYEHNLVYFDFDHHFIYIKPYIKSS